MKEKNGQTASFDPTIWEEKIQQAYQKGFEAGQMQATQQQCAQADLDKENLLSLLKGPFEWLEADAKRHLAMLVIHLVEHYIGDAIQEKPERLMALIDQAQARLPNHVLKQVICLNPEDYQSVSEQARAKLKHLHLEWKTDRQLKRGEFRVSHAQGETQYCFQSALRDLIQDTWALRLD